jgi:hypothetical protein
VEGGVKKILIGFRVGVLPPLTAASLSECFGEAAGGSAKGAFDDVFAGESGAKTGPKGEE